jgi:SulP family sulfate permease
VAPPDGTIPVSTAFSLRSVAAHRPSASNLGAGLVTAAISLVYALSFSALIFAGPLAPLLPYGLAALLIAAAMTTVVVAAGSRIPFIVAGPDSNTATVLAAIAAAVIAGRSADDQAGLLGVVTISLLGATALAGLGIYALGAARLGRWVRFVPFSVLGGFLAGTGLLMTRSALGIITGFRINADTLPRLLHPEIQARMAMGIAFALILVLVLKRWKRPLALPAMVIGGILVSHLCLLTVGLTPDKARAEGWLFQPFVFHVAWPWGHPIDALKLIGPLFGHLGEVVALMVVGTFTILLNISSLELATDQEANLDRDLRFAGIANLLSVACGGYFGSVSVNRSLMNRQAGARDRSAAAVTALGCAAILLGAGKVFAWVTVPVLGAVLLYLGIEMLLEWSWRSRKRVSRSEYLTILVIMAMIAGFGFVPGVVLGLAVGCFTFVFNYSRINAIKHQLSGKQLRSRLNRSAQENAILDAQGDTVQILTLQGYIFFGVADRIYRTVADGLTRTAASKARFIVLDCRLVTGVDAAAVTSFSRLRSFTERMGAQLVITGMGADTARDWVGGGGNRSGVKTFDDLDPALEWCEDRLLEDSAATRTRTGFMAWLAGELGGAHVADMVVRYLDALDVEPGEIICSQGDDADAIYLIERGRIEVIFDPGDNRKLRISSSTDCTVVGDIGFYLDVPRSASVVAKEPTHLHRLDRARLKKLEAEYAKGAVALHAMIVRVQSRRLVASNDLVARLLR